MTDDLATMSAAQTMSSREIADLCEKQHAHVMRDIRAMLAELYGEGDASKFGGVYRGANGEDRPCFHLPKRETLILVSGYNLAMRARIIDRWQELEAQARPIDPMVALNDPAIMRNLLLGYSEKVLALENANAELAPKAIALDRIANADGSLAVSDAAKALQMRPKDLFAWLQAHDWIYRRAGNASWLGYQIKVQSGFLEHKVTTVTRGDGSEKITEQVRVTSKGLAKLADILGQEVDRAA